ITSMIAFLLGDDACRTERSLITRMGFPVRALFAICKQSPNMDHKKRIFPYSFLVKQTTKNQRSGRLLFKYSNVPNE
ncbi:MAG: hypothetical protein AABZ06_07140, partial [Bdellovibrionota bacterium]